MAILVHLVDLVYLVYLVEPFLPSSLSFWLSRAIDEVARSRGRVSGDFLGMAGGDIFLQPLQEPENLHARRHLAYPLVCA